jgi:cytochrome P450
VQTGTERFATEDMQVGDTQIRRGDMLLVSLSAANRDSAQFEQPDEFLLSLSPGGHLGFGHGIHQCLGAPLARMEVEVAVKGLLQRLPGLRPAVAEEKLEWRPGLLMHGAQHLPVVFEGAVAAQQ